MANPQSSAATKALGELQAIAPKSMVVARFGGRIASPPDTDLFSTERFKAGIDVVEQRLLGGVVEAKEVVWLEKMLRRLVESNDISQRVPFRVKVGATTMINAFAVPNGNIYFTRGFLAHIAKRWPNVPMDENNAYVAGVMAHEITHIIKGHIVNRDLFRKALEQEGKAMDPTLFTLTTRLNEIEADREGFIFMTAAGYNPSAMVEWMEIAAKDLGEPPPMEDHPTFDERVRFLVDFWTNDLRFAYQSFETGTAALEEAQKLEKTDIGSAKGKYEQAAQEYDRFVRFFRNSKEVWNNLGIAQAKLGVLNAGETSALARWYTPLSVEKTIALKLPKIRKRGGPDMTFFNRAKESFKKALTLDAKYGRALVNLAAAHVAAGEVAEGQKLLAEAKAAKADMIVVLSLEGVLAAEAGQLDAAIAAFDAASKLSDANAGPLYCLALARQKKGDKLGAKTAYQAFLQKEDKGSAWANLAEAALKELDAPAAPAPKPGI
jgi:predicted Zn-dependent protease